MIVFNSIMHFHRALMLKEVLDNDTFTISNSQYTGILEIDGGLNDDTLEGSSISDHYGWSPC